MVWKEFYEEFDIESILEFLINDEKRNNIMNRMADIEKAGRKLSEIDRRVNMNATPEECTNYLKKHISITEDIFEEFKSMNRFKSFSRYVKEHRVRMGLKVFLPGDKKVVVSDVKSIKSKPIEVIRKNVVNKVMVPEPMKEQIKIEVRKVEPVKVVKCNCNKELIIVKRNQEVMEISATRKEATLDMQIIAKKEDDDVELEKKINEARNIMEPVHTSVNVLETGVAENKKTEPLVFNFGASN
jgi:predicted CopG family antitoxin